MFGIISIAIGDKSEIENEKCRDSFRKHLPDIPFITICDLTYDGYSDKQMSRSIKTQLPKFAPSSWSQFLYVDSDTRLQSSDITNILEPLENGFDMVLAPSMSQSFWHFDKSEITYYFSIRRIHVVLLAINYETFISGKINKFERNINYSCCPPSN